MTQVGLSSLCVYRWFTNQLGAYLAQNDGTERCYDNGGRRGRGATGLGTTIAPNVKTVLELCSNE